MAIICNDLQPWGETVKSPRQRPFTLQPAPKHCSIGEIIFWSMLSSADNSVQERPQQHWLALGSWGNFAGRAGDGELDSIRRRGEGCCSAAAREVTRYSSIQFQQTVSQLPEAGGHPNLSRSSRSAQRANSRRRNLRPARGLRHQHRSHRPGYRCGNSQAHRTILSGPQA
jgi:hypothetical protein